MLPLETVEGFTEAELNDPVFRLTCGRIYMIRNQDGEPEWFRPKPEQLRIIRMVRTLQITRRRARDFEYTTDDLRAVGCI